MKWIFRYLDAARNETDMGPYPTEEVAEKVRNRIASFGALTTPSMKVEDSYEIYIFT